VSFVSRPAQSRSQTAATDGVVARRGSPTSMRTRRRARRAPGRTGRHRRCRATGACDAAGPPLRPGLHRRHPRCPRSEIRPPERGEHSPVQWCRHEVRIRLGSSRSATSVGARANHPSTPASAPQPVQVTSPAAVSSSEQRRGVAGQACGQDERLERARRQRGPGQLLDHAQDVVDARARAASARAGRRGWPARPATPAGTGPSARCSTGSTSDRSRASEARRSRRSTSASQYSVASPDPVASAAGRSSPRTSLPIPTIRSSTPETTATPSRTGPPPRPPGTGRACGRGGAAGRPADPAPAR
jgi:hypothetical protein